MAAIHTGNFVKCENCKLKAMLSFSDIDRLDSIIERNESVAKGTNLYSIGDKFTHIHAIHKGFVKSYSISEAGEKQITGFHLPGEIVGLEGINTGFHVGFSETLVTSQVCSVPYTKLDHLSSDINGLRQQLLKVMSQEISYNYELLLLLNQKSAEEKIAAFLLNLSARTAFGKGLATEFELPMTRTDMANYLGLALETVSRIMGRFVNQKIIFIDHKQLSILRIDYLNELAGTGSYTSTFKTNIAS